MGHDTIGDVMLLDKARHYAGSVRCHGQNLKLATEFALYLNEMRHGLHARASCTTPGLNKHPLATKLLQAGFVFGHIPAVKPAEILGCIANLDCHHRWRQQNKQNQYNSFHVQFVPN